MYILESEWALDKPDLKRQKKKKTISNLLEALAVKPVLSITDRRTPVAASRKSSSWYTNPLAKVKEIAVL